MQAMPTQQPRHGLPDMVFAANSALVIDGVALLARFRHAQRAGEERFYEKWFRVHGFDVRHAEPMISLMPIRGRNFRYSP